MRYRLLTRLGWVAAAFLFAASLPAPAHAQFGGLIKKAKAKVGGSSADNDGPKYDQSTVGLGPDQVAQMIKGLKAEHEFLVRIPPLMREMSAADSERNALSRQNPNVSPAYQQALDRNRDCREKAMQQWADENKGTMMAAMMNPQTQMQQAQLGQQLGLAMQRGDTVQIHKIATQIAATSPVAKFARADTAAADKQCSKGPAKPTVLAHEDSLQAVYDRDLNKTRELLVRMRHTAFRRLGGPSGACRAPCSRWSTMAPGWNGGGRTPRRRAGRHHFPRSRTPSPGAQ